VIVQPPAVLLTGGAGYIGSHTAVELIGAGYAPVILDNFCNSSPKVVDRIGRITGIVPHVVDADIRDAAALEATFARFPIAAVVHFAGLKAVGESVAHPILYYQNNVSGTLCLCEAMLRHGVGKMVFSSSATVYGNAAEVPTPETAPPNPANPYGRSKYIIEQVLADVAAANPSWRVVILRYFNPAGAHESGLIGESPRDIPNNLMPIIARVATGRHDRLRVYGSDYPTPDGTGIRDYVHVADLARGHVAALARLLDDALPPIATINLGTGIGHTVMEVVRAFEHACGRRIALDVVARRPGDVTSSIAAVGQAESRLGWRAQRDLDSMCADSWRWQTANPDGYGQ